MTFPTDRRLPGLAIVAAAVAAAVLGWAALSAAGIELQAEQSGELREVGVAQVVFAAAIGGVLAWVVHSLMARRPSTLRFWPFVGTTALAVSMLGPSYLADGESAAGLIALHFLVAIVLILGFAALDAREGPSRNEPRPSNEPFRRPS